MGERQGSPASGTEAAIADVVDHIAITYPVRRTPSWPRSSSRRWRTLPVPTASSPWAFSPGLDPAANSLAAALDQRLAQIPGERVWQMEQPSRGTFDNIQRAIAEGLARKPNAALIFYRIR